MHTHFGPLPCPNTCCLPREGQNQHHSHHVHAHAHGAHAHDHGRGVSRPPVSVEPHCDPPASFTPAPNDRGGKKTKLKDKKGNLSTEERSDSLWHTNLLANT